MKHGMIVYTDGGAKPNPGAGGWGFHGYLYLAETPKKGSGNKDVILTAKGYVSRVDSGLRMGIEGNIDRRAYDRSHEVTPIHYVDAYGSFAGDVSNNVGELTAAIMALKHASNYDIDQVQIFADSEYVCKGLREWVQGWIRNNWMKPDGSERANIDEWKELVELKTMLENRDVKVRIDWVKGHADVFGNVLADRLASIGVLASKRLIARNEIKTSVAEGYWKYDPERHPFLFNRRMYFNTMPEYLRPGEYYLGEHGKDDDLLGKRISDGAYSVVMLEKPDPVLEMIRSHQSLMAGSNDTIIMARLDQAFLPDIHKELAEYGTLVMEQPDGNRLDLTIRGEPLTRELRPAKLAMRAVEAVSDLAERMHLYLQNHASITTTDLTSILYETTVKTDAKNGPVTEMALKSDYYIGFAQLPVQANYHTEHGVQSAALILTLGIDLVDRNALKRLEKMQPKVTLITWNESPTVFRYATVIESGKDRGIWAGVYSNLRIVA